MNQLTEPLNGTDHPGHSVGPAAGGAVDADHGARRRPAQVAQQPALEPEVDPRPLGNREHELAMGHLGADVLGHPAGLLQCPLLVAVGTVYLGGDKDEAPYDVVAERLQMSVNAVKKNVERMRRRFGQVLRAEIAQTVLHPSETEDELRFLRAALHG
jgi:hypothetical protein